MADAEIRRLEAVIEQTVREREELVRRGAILAEESGAAAGRLNREIGELDRRAAGLAEQAVSAGERQARLRLERETAAVETRAATERAAAERRRLDEAMAERHALEQKALLRALLEIESVNLERLPDRALLQLREASHAALESIVTLKMERAEDERAAAHLEDTGLLPPSRDAQRVLAALRAKLPAAWSGWAYIEANTPDIERIRYDLAQRRALLATGVIVRDADFDKACELLEADERATPDSPILIAPASAFANESAPEGKVFGPASSAYYDRSEGRSELLRRRISLDAVEAKIHQGEDRRREIEELDNQIREFRGRYPRGWFAEQEAKLDRESRPRPAGDTAPGNWRRRSPG